MASLLWNVPLPVVLAIVLAVYLGARNVPVDFHAIPITVTPSTVGFTGPFAPNTVLADKTKKIHVGEVNGPETVWFDKDGKLFTVSANAGTILEEQADGHLHEWAFVGDVPLSGVFDENGDVIIAVASKGLLRVDHVTRQSTVLCNRAGGKVIRFADDVTISKKTGKIYFSDASYLEPPRIRGDFYDANGAAVNAFLSGVGGGRLVEYDPAIRSCNVLLDDIIFANGVELADDESFVLLVDTFRSRVHRVYLTGDHAGKHDIFVEDIPFLLDGISAASDGGFWLAGVTTELDATVRMVSPFPFIKNILPKLPPFAPAHFGCVIKLDRHGHVEYSLQDPSGETISGVTSATEHNGVLYLGSFHNYVAVINIKDIPSN